MFPPSPFFLSLSLTDEKDWNSVVIACKTLSLRWQELSVNLGISPSDIGKFAKNHPQDVSGCLSDALVHWIRQNYDTKQYGLPSWRTLLRAVAQLDKLLFKKLASEHPVLCESLSDCVLCSENTFIS